MKISGTSDGVRSTMSVESAGGLVWLVVKQGRRETTIRLHADQARRLAHLIEDAVDDVSSGKTSAPPLRNTRDDGGVL